MSLYLVLPMIFSAGTGDEKYSLLAGSWKKGHRRAVAREVRRLFLGLVRLPVIFLCRGGGDCRGYCQPARVRRFYPNT